MSMYIQSFTSASDCADKINEMLDYFIPKALGLKAIPIKDEDPRGYYVSIEVAENYPYVGTMRHIADLSSHILEEYTNNSQEIDFFRPGKDSFTAKLYDICSRKPAPMLG